MAHDDTRDSLARALDPNAWLLAEDPRYAHLPQQAHDTILAKSREAAELALAWMAAHPSRPAGDEADRVRFKVHGGEIVATCVSGVVEVMAVADGEHRPDAMAIRPVASNVATVSIVRSQP